MANYKQILEDLERADEAALATSAVTPEGQLPTADFSQTPATAKAVLRSPDPVKEAPVFEEMGIGEKIVNSVSAGWHNRLKSEAASDLYNYVQMAKGGLSALVDDEEDESVKALLAKDTKASRDFNAKYEQLATESAFDLIDLQKEDYKYAAPAAVQNAAKSAEGKGFVEGVSAGFSEIAKDPLNSLIYLGGSSFGAIAPEIGVSLVPGVVIARMAKLPTIARAVQGAIMASGSYRTELGSYMLDRLQEQGVDMTNADAIKTAMADPKMADIYQKAKARATVVAALDGASGTLASIHLRPSNAVRHLREAASLYKDAQGLHMADAWRMTAAPAAKTRAAKFAGELENIATQTAMQGVAGGAGEALGALAAGDQINWAEVLFEAVGELVSAPSEVLTMSASVNAEFKNQEQTVATTTAAGEQWTKINQAAAAIASKVQNGETVQQWAQDLGQDRVVFAFAQDLVDNGTVEKIREVNPDLADRIEKVAAEKSDIAIPVSDVVGVATKDEALAQSIIYDSRVDPAGMTPRQAEEFQKTGKEEAAKAFAKVIDIAKPDIETRKAIDTEVKKIRDQLVGAGTAKEIADLQVMPWGAWIATRCATLGKTPAEIMGAINLRIRREAHTGDGRSIEQGGTLPYTVNIDGREMPTVDSEGNHVGRNEEEVRALYRWLEAGSPKARPERAEAVSGRVDNGRTDGDGDGRGGSDLHEGGRDGNRGASQEQRAWHTHRGVRSHARGDVSVFRPDESRGPVVFYHGASAVFDEVQIEHKGKLDSGYLGKGFYVTTNRDHAINYADKKGGMNGTDGAVMSLYARVKNPAEVSPEFFRYMHEIRDRGERDAASNEFRDRLISEGYDSAYLVRMERGKPYYEVVLFDPSQVKAARSMQDDQGRPNTGYRTDSNNVFEQRVVKIKSDKDFDPNWRPLRRTAENMTPKETAVFNEYIDSRPDAARIRANFERLDGTPWAMQAREAVFVRASILDLMDGREPRVQSMVDHPQMRNLKILLQKNGEEGLWQRLAESKFVGDAAKPAHNVNGSFLDCSPSDDCAKFCYATEGNYRYAATVVKSELIAEAVRRDPVRAAEMTARDYKATHEFIKGKALRLYDKGDGGEAWIPYINELNKLGVRVQIFSKRAEFLRDVSDFNLRLLSIDASNLKMADEYPDLKVAFVYSDPGQVSTILDLHRQGRVSVILPVKEGRSYMSSDKVAELRKADKTLAKHICPIDAGWKKIKTGKQPDGWNCTMCDKNAGVGCFHGASTEAVMRAASKNEAELIDVEGMDLVALAKLLQKEMGDDLARVAKSGARGGRAEPELGSVEGSSGGSGTLNVSSELADKLQKLLSGVIRRGERNRGQGAGGHSGGVRQGAEQVRAGVEEADGELYQRSSAGDQRPGAEGATADAGLTTEQNGRIIPLSDRFDTKSDNVLRQTAYHGSPYSFDKFTLNHIGSGEGAQAHGWGLYFALDKGVAEGYRERLTEDDLPDTYDALTAKVESITDEWREKGFNFQGAGDVSQVYGAIFIARTEGKDSAVGRTVGDYVIVESTEEARKAREGGQDEISVDELMDLDSASDTERVSDMSEAMDVINSMDYSFRAPDLVRDIVWQSGYRDSVADLIINDLAEGFDRQMPGGVYTVEIPEDDVMLREDAAFEDQPQQVKDGILAVYSIIKGNRWEMPDIYAFKDPSRAYELLEKAYNLYKNAHQIDEQTLRQRSGDIELALDLLSQGGNSTVKNAIESVRAQAIKDRGTEKLPWVSDHLEGMTGEEILKEIENEFGGPKEAAGVLLDHGVMGIRYNGYSDGECAVVWSEDAIKMRNFLEQAMENDYRGAFVPSNAVNVADGIGGLMRLMDSADKSTFLHESAHAWLDADTMLAREIADKAARGEELTEGEKRFLNNLGGFFRWGQQEGVIDLGVTDDPNSVIRAAQRWAAMTTTEQTGMHELFAEGFESYLMDGVSPNNEMRSVFGRFKSWLMDIYQQATRRPRPISREVRKLYDLMFATEQQAQQTETRLGLRALLLGNDAKQSLGLTDDEVQAFKDLDAQATAECAGLVAKRIRGALRLYGRVRKSKLRELRQTEKEAIDKKEAELLEEPRYIAVRLLTSGIRGEDGKMTRMKISRASLGSIPVETYENLSKKGFIAEEGGVPLEALANAAGTTDSVGLLSDLVEISRVADARSEAERFVAYQQAQDGVDIELTAELAAHNATRSRFLTAEYNAVARALGSRQVLVNTARDIAVEQIGGMKVADLYPSAYMAAERRCAKDAEKAMAKGDLAAVLEAKRGQIMNHEMARAALEAQADYTRLQRAAKRAAKSPTIHPKYKKVLFALLDAHSVNNMTAAQRERFAADSVDPEEVEKVVASMEEAGTPIEGLRELLMDRVHARDMSTNDMRDLYAVVKQIETLGRNVYKQNLINGKRRINDIVDECNEGIKEAADEQGREVNENQRVPMTRMERLKDNMSKFLAEHMKISALCRIMDRNKEGGIMWRTFVESSNKCATLENSLRQKVAKTLADKLLPVFKNGFEEDPVRIDGFDRPFTHGMRLAVALNWGNESNRRRLLEGDTRFTSEAMAQIFEHLTEADWRAVEAVWKAFEDLRPMVAAKEERVYGTQPEWIAYGPFTVTTAEGKTISLSGGYYPVKFDPRGSNRAGVYADAETVKQEMQGAYQSATTRRSFTKSRVKGEVRMPLRLDLAGLYEGFTDVIHDLAWHEWLIDTGRVLRGVDGDGTGVRKAINDHYGHNIARQFEDWRKDIATGGRDMGATDWIARFSRNVGVAAMGYSLTSAAVQLTGIGYVVPRVGVAATTLGLVKYLANPVKTRRNIDRMSEAMRLRGITQNREISQIKNRIDGKQGWLYNHAYTIMQWVQNVVDSIAWMAAYERYSRDGFVGDELVHLADQLVIDTQSSGNINDLSAIERNKNLRIFTVFYSFMNAALNLNLVEAMGEKNRAKAYAKICFMSVIMPIAESYLREAIKAGGDEDDDLDDDELIIKHLRKSSGAVVDYNLGLFFLLREVSSIAKGLAAGEPIYGYSGPAGVRAAGDIAKFAQAMSAEDPFSWAALNATVNLAGDFTGAPSVQINRTIKGIRAIESGQADGIDAIMAPIFGYDGRIDE